MKFIPGGFMGKKRSVKSENSITEEPKEASIPGMGDYMKFIPQMGMGKSNGIGNYMKFVPGSFLGKNWSK